VHRPDWYLSITEPRDVIEAMLPGDLDLSGWDLRKTLGLFLRCNLALNEWLDSPIVYTEYGECAGQLRRLLPAAFRAPAGYHHYLSMAKGKYHDTLVQDAVRLKDVFYALRALLACRWIARSGAQPPTEFARLVAAPWVDASERRRIAALTAAKASAKESERTPLEADTRAWLQRELDAAQDAAAAIRSEASLQTATLDELLRATVRSTWHAAGEG
jgi:predicted nucleotidyltransferase